MRKYCNIAIFNIASLAAGSIGLAMATGSSFSGG